MTKPRELKAAKVARLFADNRIRMVRADTNPQRLSLAIIGDSTDAFDPKPYAVVRERNEYGTVVESCSCANPKATCTHLEAARQLSRILDVPKGEHA